MKTNHGPKERSFTCSEQNGSQEAQVELLDNNGQKQDRLYLHRQKRILEHWQSWRKSSSIKISTHTPYLFSLFTHHMGEYLISHPGITCIESVTSGSLPPPPPVSVQSVVTRKEDLFTWGAAWRGGHIDETTSVPVLGPLRWFLRGYREGGERQSWCIWVRGPVWYLAKAGDPRISPGPWNILC